MVPLTLMTLLSLSGPFVPAPDVPLASPRLLTARWLGPVQLRTVEDRIHKQRRFTARREIGDGEIQFQTTRTHLSSHRLPFLFDPRGLASWGTVMTAAVPLAAGMIGLRLGSGMTRLKLPDREWAMRTVTARTMFAGADWRTERGSIGLGVFRDSSGSARDAREQRLQMLYGAPRAARGFRLVAETADTLAADGRGLAINLDARLQRIAAFDTNISGLRRELADARMSITGTLHF